MLIVECDICKTQTRPAGYVYDENPHYALVGDCKQWQVIHSNSHDYDLCPDCANRYVQMLHEQELRRTEFLDGKLPED